MRNSSLRAACVCCVLGLVVACTTQRVPPPSTDIDETGFRNDVRVLASDEFEGRKPGTPGEDKSVAFLVEQFKKLGLKPGNGDSYVQQVPLVEMLPDGDPTLTISGRGQTKALAYTKDMLIWTKRVVPDAEVQHSELVFVGYGIVAPEYQWDDYAGTDVHGKTVVVLVNDPGYGSKDPRVFKGNAQTYYGRWTYKLEEAARHGAAGVLLIHDAAAAGYGWNVLVNGRSGPQLELASPDDGAQWPAIAGWISADAGRALFAQAGLDLLSLGNSASRPGFKPIDLHLTADARLHLTLRRFTSANVIAVLPGAKLKHEYVLYTAHWDHLGRQPAEQGGAIFSGAVDDASGVAGLLMLAQSLKRTQPTPDRSIAFIAFTAEEAGLLGSQYYVANPVFALRETAGVINLDMLHVGGPTRDVMIFGYGNSELEDYVREAALLQGRATHPDPNPDQGLYYRSDQFSFARAGVPALFAAAGIDDSARGPAWGQAQLDDYRQHRYHQPSDKYSPEWDVRGTLDDLKIFYDVGLRLARTRRFPRWYPNSEFRASHHRRAESPEQRADDAD